MAKLVKKDTYAYEQVNPHGDVVRREVFAGQYVPDGYVEGDDTESGAFEEVEAGRGPGLGAGSPEYPHQRGVSIEDQLERRLGKKPTEAQVLAAKRGGQASVDAGEAGPRAYAETGNAKTKRRGQSADPGDDRPKED